MFSDSSSRSPNGTHSEKPLSSTTPLVKKSAGGAANLEEPSPQGVENLPATPKKVVDGFSRKILNETFGPGTSNKGFTKKGEKTGMVVKSSPAVKEGLVLVREDEYIDQRCSAVKLGLVKLDQDGSVIKKDSLLCQEQIVFNKDHSISRTSAAVVNGLLKLNDKGQVDKRCSAARRGWILVDDTTGSVKKDSPLCQRLYLKETNGAHIHGFELAHMITKIAGFEYDEETAIRMAIAINEDKNVRTKTYLGNMSGAATAPKGSGDLAVDRVIAMALEQAKTSGEYVQLSPHASQRASRCIKNILEGDFPVNYKIEARGLFTMLKDADGRKIVRSNAKLTVPAGKAEYFSHISGGKDEVTVNTSSLPVPKNLFADLEAAEAADNTPTQQNGVILKKDGTPDMRYSQNKIASREQAQLQKEREQQQRLREQAQLQKEREQQQQLREQAQLQKEREQQQRLREQAQLQKEREQQQRLREQAQLQKEREQQQRLREQAQLQKEREQQQRLREQAQLQKEREQQQRLREQAQRDYQQQQAASQYVSSPYSGSFSGSYHTSGGSANGSALFTGPRGGTYYINSNGNKSYVR